MKKRKLNFFSIFTVALLCCACQKSENTMELVDPEIICAMVSTHNEKVLEGRLNDFPKWATHLVENVAYYLHGQDMPVLHNKMKQGIDFTYAQILPNDEAKKLDFLENFASLSNQYCLDHF